MCYSFMLYHVKCSLRETLDMQYVFHDAILFNATWTLISYKAIDWCIFIYMSAKGYIGNLILGFNSENVRLPFICSKIC